MSTYRYKQLSKEKGSLFFTVQYQLINKERITEIEKSPSCKYHSNAVTGKSHQWMQLLGKTMMRNKIFAQSQSIFPQEKRERENTNFPIENLAET